MSYDKGIFDGVLLVSDLDGTLMGSGGGVSGENDRAIRSFMDQGGTFTVATGRSIQGFEAVRLMVPMNAPAILSGGALVFDYETRTPLRVVTLSMGFLPLCQAALSVFPGVAMEAHLMEGVYAVGQNEYSLLHQQIVATNVSQAAAPADIPEGWLKALFIAPHADLLALREWLQPHCQDKYDLVFSHPLLLEMQDARADKGEGVSWLAWHLDIPHKHVRCAGDHQNDLSMLKRFRSFAPQSALPEVKAAVGFTGPVCDDNFIAWVISRLAQQYSPR